ncbi:T9SS type A sorting domain-containing protein [candidate division KSB1 bacterium]|nr:T9SS type A sorting domain-containing protein [candidate division KSB1 bacterium]
MGLIFNLSKSAIRIICSSVVLMLSPALAEINATPSTVDLSGYLYSRFTPAVIRSDSTHSIMLEVATTGLDIQEVMVDWMYFNKVVWLQMFDDGSHGDRIAADGIYTLDNLVRKCDSHAGYFEGHHRWTGAHVKIKKIGGQEYQHVISFGMVDRQTVWPAEDLGDGCFATTSAFFIADTEGEIMPGYPLTPISCGQTVFTGAYKKLYDHFPDVFDFIIVMPANTLYQPDTYLERVPYCVMAKNDIQHIGVPIFDETAQYRSAGYLHAVIYHSFGYGAILEHEVGHMWGMRLGVGLGLLQYAGGPLDRYGHWRAEADINGQMSCFVDGKTIVDNGDGTWRLNPQDPIYMPYSPLELYIMGLLPANEVPPVHILFDPDYSDPNRVTADSVKTYTIDEIMAAEGGKRIPSLADAQKAFKAAFIIISDRAFSDAEFAYFSLVAEFFASDSPGYGYLTPFETATGNRATLDISLPGMEYLTVEHTAADHTPQNMILQQNYPNPFNSTTTIRYTLGEKSFVTLSVFDISGRQVALIRSGETDAGEHSLQWHADNLSSGIYLYKLSAGGVSVSKKLLLIK